MPTTNDTTTHCIVYIESNHHMAYSKWSPGVPFILERMDRSARQQSADKPLRARREVSLWAFRVV